MKNLIDAVSDVDKGAELKVEQQQQNNNSNNSNNNNTPLLGPTVSVHTKSGLSDEHGRAKEVHRSLPTTELVLV